MKKSKYLHPYILIIILLISLLTCTPATSNDDYPDDVNAETYEAMETVISFSLEGRFNETDNSEPPLTWAIY